MYPPSEIALVKQRFSEQPSSRLETQGYFRFSRLGLAATRTQGPEAFAAFCALLQLWCEDEAGDGHKMRRLRKMTKNVEVQRFLEMVDVAGVPHFFMPSRAKKSARNILRKC